MASVILPDKAEAAAATCEAFHDAYRARSRVSCEVGRGDLAGSLYLRCTQRLAGSTARDAFADEKVYPGIEATRERRSLSQQQR